MALDRRGERQGSASAPAETLLLASPQHRQRQVRHSPAPAPAVPPRGAPGAQRERGAPGKDLQPLLLPPLLHWAPRCKHLPPGAACRAGTQLGPLADVLPSDTPEGAHEAASSHGTAGLGQVEAGVWSIFCHLQAAGERGLATARGGKEKQGWLCSVPPSPRGDFSQRFCPDAPARLVLLRSLHRCISAFRVLFLRCWIHPSQAISWVRAHTFGALLAPWGAGSWSGGRVAQRGAWQDDEQLLNIRSPPFKTGRPAGSAVIRPS